MNKKILTTGAIFALIAVLLGAFGAHGLEKLVDYKSVESFRAGVRYQMYHAIVLLILGSILVISDTHKKRIYYFFLLGTILFSGSIYFLVVDEVLGISLARIAFITPIGGLLLIIGWILFVISLMKTK